MTTVPKHLVNQLQIYTASCEAGKNGVATPEWGNNINSDKEKIIHSIYRNVQTCLIKKLIAYWGFVEPKVQFSY